MKNSKYKMHSTIQMTRPIKKKSMPGKTNGGNILNKIKRHYPPNAMCKP